MVAQTSAPAKAVVTGKNLMFVANAILNDKRGKNMAKIHDVAYCFHCKKYYDENLTDGQGFICCPNCKGAYRFNVMQLSYEKPDGYCIQVQDEFVLNFKDKKQFNNLMFLMRNLLKKANRREIS